MKAQLTFDLTDDQHAFDCAINGAKYYDLLDDVRQQLRALEKYHDLTEEQASIIERLRGWLHTELLNAGVADKF